MEHPGLEDGLLFKVIGKDGHQYKGFTDGRIEGFGDGCLVMNYFQVLLATEKAKLLRRQHDQQAALLTPSTALGIAQP